LDHKRKEFTILNPQSEIVRGIGVAAVFHGMSLGAEGADYAVGRWQSTTITA